MSNWREYVSQDTIRILDDLILLKNNTVDLSKTKKMYLVIVMISMLLYTILFVLTMMGAEEQEILQSLSSFFFNTYSLVWLGITGYFYMQSMLLQNQITDKKTSCENLRQEIIVHLENSWYIHEYTAIRDAISEELEQNGINIRYRSR